MGQQCHTKLVHVIKRAQTVTIVRDHYESGGGDDQDQPWDCHHVDVLLPNGALLYFELCDNGQDIWFDANHWGSNRWQIEEMRKVGIPYIES